MSGWVYIAIGSIGVVIGAVLIPYGYLVLQRGPTLDKADLSRQAWETSRQVLEFTVDRRANEPSIDFERWEESTSALTRYSNETNSLYNSRYASKVVFLRDELKKYGLSDENLDMLCDHATNMLIIESGAIALGNLALKVAYEAE